jgi:hypothetical protein
LTDRFSRILSSSDFQKVFLGILESASIRSVKSGMLREIGGRNPSGDGAFYWFSKLDLNTLRKGESMEIVKFVHDLAAVLVFLGVLMTPRAILTYFAPRGEK